MGHAFIGFSYNALLILVLVALWFIFVKAKQPGWAAIIPIYNILIYLEIVGKPWWWIFLMFIPFVNFIFFIWMSNLMSKSFGKNEGFTVGLVFLPFIFYPILGFGSDEYQGPTGAKTESVE